MLRRVLCFGVAVCAAACDDGGAAASAILVLQRARAGITVGGTEVTAPCAGGKCHVTCRVTGAQSHRPLQLTPVGPGRFRVALGTERAAWVWIGPPGKRTPLRCRPQEGQLRCGR